MNTAFMNSLFGYRSHDGRALSQREYFAEQILKVAGVQTPGILATSLASAALALGATATVFAITKIARRLAHT